MIQSKPYADSKTGAWALILLSPFTLSCAACDDNRSPSPPGDAALTPLGDADGPHHDASHESDASVPSTTAGIVQDLAPGRPRSIEVDERYVYWSEIGNGGPLIKRGLKAGGGTHETLGKGGKGHALGSLAVDQDSVFWLDGDAVVTVPKAGGSEARLSLGRSEEWGVIQASEGRVYIAGESCTWLGWLSKAGGALHSVENSRPSMGGNTGLFVEEGTVYCANGNSIFAWDTATQSVQTLRDDQRSSAGIVKGGTNLYWVDADLVPNQPQHIKSMDLATGILTDYGSGNVGYAGPLLLDEARGRLFWMSGGEAGGVMSLELGTRSFLKMVQNRKPAGDLATDDEYVYWTESTAIASIRNPR